MQTHLCVWPAALSSGPAHTRTPQLFKCEGRGRVTRRQMRKATLPQAEGSAYTGIFSPVVVCSRSLWKMPKRNHSTAVCWEMEKEHCCVGCRASHRQVCCPVCRAVGSWLAAYQAMQEATLAPGQSVAGVSRVASWGHHCIACLAFFSWLVCGDSLVWAHNWCFIFITVDAKLAFLSAWSRKESRFLVGFNHLLSGFPWRFTWTTTISTAADPAGQVAAGRFFSPSGPIPAYFLRRRLASGCGEIYLTTLFESAVASKCASEEGTLDKCSFQIK